MTAFNPDTPPRRDDGLVIGVASAEQVERSNAAILGEAAEAEMRRVQGNTATLTEGKQTEAQKRMEARRQVDAQRVAASGGATVTSALRGGIGEAVAEVLRLDQIDDAAKRIETRLRDEAARLEKQRTLAASTEKLSGLIDDCWNAVSAKSTAPEILPEFVRWYDHGRPRAGVNLMLSQGIDLTRAKRQTARHERIVDRRSEVNTIVVEFAADVLDRARQAACTLESAGLTVDSTAEQIIAVLDLDAQRAAHAWRTAVGDWSDVQSARRYVIEALNGTGPTQAKGSYALTVAPGVDTAAEVWSTQFVGVSLPRWVSDAHSALKYAVDEGSDLTPAGVSN